MARRWLELPVLAINAATDSAAENFIRDACSIVGSRLESGARFALVPSEIMERLEESGILARYNVHMPKPIPATLGVREWQPTDEVIEVENPTIDGWVSVVRAAERSRTKIHHMLDRG